MGHGVAVNEVPTGVKPPVSISAGLPVYVWARRRSARSTEAANEVNRKASEALDKYEGLAHQARLAILESNKQLAVISKDVDDVERAHQLAAHADTRVGLVQAFGALPKFTQVLIALLFLLLAAGGWLHMIFK
jgi:hypothetical protein